jgi:hypothetical protein
MADHKFTYTISGVDLSDEQRATISREIGAAVARVLIGASPKTVRSDFINISKIQGGRWLPTDLAAKDTVEKLVATGCGEQM